MSQARNHGDDHFPTRLFSYRVAGPLLPVLIVLGVVLADLTPRTITSAPELLRHLDASPVAPAVTDLEEYSLGTVCVAVPVYNGDTLGSLGVSLRADRLSRLEEILARLIPAASRVTRGLSLTI